MKFLAIYFSIYYFAFTTDTELASNVNNDILFFSWWYIPVKTLSVIPFICHMVRITATATEQAAKTTSWNNFGARTSISFHFWKEGSIFLKQFKLKLLKKMRAGASLLAVNCGYSVSAFMSKRLSYVIQNMMKTLHVTVNYYFSKIMCGGSVSQKWTTQGQAKANKHDR